MKDKAKTLGLADAVRKHLGALEHGKKAYQRAEQLLDEIVASGKTEIALGGGKRAVVKDLYAEKNRVYRAHGITRYQVDVVEDEE